MKEITVCFPWNFGFVSLRFFGSIESLLWHAGFSIYGASSVAVANGLNCPTAFGTLRFPTRG